MSEQKCAEEALRASEERRSKLAENSSAGIALVAPDGRFIAANLALQEMLGYTENELRGRTLLDITHEEDRGATETGIAEAYNGRRRVYRVEKRYLRKDAGIMWADVSLVFVPANGSNAAFFSAVIIDRTERKWAEEALQKAQAERELEVSSQKAGNIQGESKEERSEDRALTEVEWTHVLITVRYSGPGLDPESIDRLFVRLSLRVWASDWPSAVLLLQLTEESYGRKQMRRGAPCFSSRCRFVIRGRDNRKGGHGSRWQRCGRLRVRVAREA